MRFPVLHPQLTTAARLCASAMFGVLLVGLSIEWLPFGWTALLLALALVLPFFWSRQTGTWSGVLLLIAVSWSAALALQIGALPSFAVSMLLLIILSALFASPSAMVLLIRRRSASVALMLLGFTSAIAVFTILLARIGPPSAESTGAAATSLSQLAWLLGLWYPILAMCLGSLGFVLSLSWLVVREAGRTTQ